MYIIPIQFATPEYDDTVRLRLQILREPIGLSFTVKDLEQEYLFDHLAAYDDRHRLVACLVLKPLNEQEIKMEQVAVKEALQKQGIGTQLVAASEALAKSKGYTRMVLHARANAVPFYERLDYSKEGDPFEEVGMEHFRMGKEV